MPMLNRAKAGFAGVIMPVTSEISRNALREKLLMLLHAHKMCTMVPKVLQSRQREEPVLYMDANLKIVRYQQCDILSASSQWFTQ